MAAEETWSLKEAARMLWINTYTLEQWISRGHMKPEQSGIGRNGRRWTFRDLVKAKILLDINEATIRVPAQLGLAELVPLEPGAGRFIVVRTPEMKEHEIRQMGGGIIHERHAVTDGMLMLTDRKGAAATLGEHTVSMVINIDRVEHDVRTAIASLADLENRLGPVDEKASA